ncbi:extracellular solute-binding protein [Dictyobacter kobayashii]|uniref:ABC transporter substrate-binding protein n=1 Tax=Dictyobacter kobayashii TaxID=2014872 RepID=A0A402AGP5_9CHLR|nr:extracellular solute-binding protein [Dictyobacter kobayashii]GCE18298.1 ABC transporter substrate-binding protein [Dictyobacter kobayashii]
MGNPQQSLVQDFLTGKIGRRAFIGRAVGLGVSLASVEAFVAACGGGSTGGGSSASIKWSNWANTGELARFKAFTDDYNNTHHTSVHYDYVPSANNNYFTKITTELNGGVAPDAFYVGDGDVAKLVANHTVMQLNDLLSSSKSKESADDFLPGLWGAAKTKSGKIYGVPVDCNPLLLWFNKKVLNDAGITTMPTDLYDQGKWTRPAFQDMIEKIHANGKQGFVLEAWSLQFYAWCTTNGGQIYDNNGYGNFIAHEDPKSLEAFKWLADQINKKTMIYAGSLPKGQGSDLAFIGNQVGFISVGRWDLPEFKSAGGLEFDCVPFPSATGTIAPAPVALAYMVINKKTKLQDAAFDFVTNYVSAAGQTFRLHGGGNAVPSIKSTDTEKVVLEGNSPAHAKYLLDARNIGYGLFPAEGSAPALSDDIKTALEPVWLQGKDITTTLASVAAMANPRVKAAQNNLQ